ncbi:MAG: hypothetical protein ACXWWC_02915 [Chitinophagaceae bacterium]
MERTNALAKGSMAHVLLAKKKYAEAFELIRQFPKTVISRSDDYQGPYLVYAYLFPVIPSMRGRHWKKLY